MKAIKIPVEGKAELVEIDNELKPLQEAVGGYIETLTIASDCCLICNEEGRLKGKPLNVRASQLGTLIVGDVLIVGVDEDEFTDVPEAAIKLFKERWPIL